MNKKRIWIIIASISIVLFTGSFVYASSGYGSSMASQNNRNNSNSCMTDNNHMDNENHMNGKRAMHNNHMNNR